MLPDIRAVIAAVMAAAGLLMIAFATVATYRVAEQHQSGSLQAGLETPAPHVLPVAVAAPSEPIAAPVKSDAAPTVEPEPPAAVLAAPEPTPVAVAAPPAEPPISGPLVDARATQKADRARRARDARLVRARKAAARRAAKARTTPSFEKNFGNFGGTYSGPIGPSRNSAAAPRAD